MSGAITPHKIRWRAGLAAARSRQYRSCRRNHRHCLEGASLQSRLGVAALITFSTSLLKKNIRGGLIIVGEINLGGSIEPVHDAVTITEIAVEKGATALLMPVACRRQLVDLSDDMATKVDVQFYSDARDALLKAIVEQRQEVDAFYFSTS